MPSIKIEYRLLLGMKINFLVVARTHSSIIMICETQTLLKYSKDITKKFADLNGRLMADS